METGWLPGLAGRGADWRGWCDRFSIDPRRPGASGVIGGVVGGTAGATTQERLAIASITWGGASGLVFQSAMCANMFPAPGISVRIDAQPGHA